MADAEEVEALPGLENPEAVTKVHLHPFCLRTLTGATRLLYCCVKTNTA